MTHNNPMKKTIQATYKDLEMQIDFLTGYTPLGLHWKKEYYARQEYIQQFLSGDVPQEVRDKIERIQSMLLEMRADKKSRPQPYITPEFFCDEFFYNRYNEERTIIVNDSMHNRRYTL